MFTPLRAPCLGLAVLLLGACGKETPAAPQGEPHVALDGLLTFVPVPAGTFQQGTPEGGDSPDNDEFARRVTLTHDLLVSRTETTRAAWEALGGTFVDHNASCLEPACPVVDITWHQAAAAANALSTREGLAPCYSCDDAGVCAPVEGPPAACPGYRMPTEAEWEYAARGGTTGTWSAPGRLPDGADELCEAVQLDGGGMLGAFSWYCGNAASGPRPVATLQANPWGLYDVHGNLWEWCSDWYEARYGTDDPTAAVTDPAGARLDGNHHQPPSRSARGGSYLDSPRNTRSADRSYGEPHEPKPEKGVRWVRTAP